MLVFFSSLRKVMLRTCIDTETSTKEYPPYTKAIYNNGGIYGKNGNLRNLHQRALTAGIGQVLTAIDQPSIKLVSVLSRRFFKFFGANH